MAGPEAAGVVLIPIYATAFRPDRLAPLLDELAAESLRYGAQSYQVLRSRNDRYRFTFTVAFPDNLSWERYWYGREWDDFRTDYTSWFQVPLTPEWQDVVSEGRLRPAEPATPPAQPV